MSKQAGNTFQRPKLFVMLALSQVCRGQVQRLILQRQVLILACNTLVIEVVVIINKPIDTDQLLVLSFRVFLLLMLFFVQLDHDLFELLLVQLYVKMNLLLKAILVLPVVVVLKKFDLLELDEQAQFHLVDLVLALQQLLVLHLYQFHLRGQLRV